MDFSCASSASAILALWASSAAAFCNAQEVSMVHWPLIASSHLSSLLLLAFQRSLLGLGLSICLALQRLLNPKVIGVLSFLMTKRTVRISRDRL